MESSELGELRLTGKFPTRRLRLAERVFKTEISKWRKNVDWCSGN